MKDDPTATQLTTPPTTDEPMPCVQCGYDLRLLPVDASCPECATPPSVSRYDGPPFVHRPPEPCQVGYSVRCVRCGQALDGLSTDEPCPGCNNPAWFSIYGRWLRAEDPRWLRRVRNGLTCWFWNLILVVALNIAGFVTPFVGEYLLDEPILAFDAFQIVQQILGPANMALWLVAILLIASPEPARAMAGSGWSLRHCLRVFVLVDLALDILVRLSRKSPTDPFWPISSTLPGWYLREAIGMALAVGSLVFVRRLAQRIPDPRLRRSTSIVLLGKISCLFILLMVNALGQYQVHRGTGFTFGGTAVGLITAAASLALLAFTCWLAILVTRYRASVRRALLAVSNETSRYAAA